MKNLLLILIAVLGTAAIAYLGYQKAYQSGCTEGRSQAMTIIDTVVVRDTIIIPKIRSIAVGKPIAVDSIYRHRIDSLIAHADSLENVVFDLALPYETDHNDSLFQAHVVSYPLDRVNALDLYIKPIPIQYPLYMVKPDLGLKPTFWESAQPYLIGGAIGIAIVSTIALLR